MAVQVSKRVFNVDEYYRMAEAGILSEDDRVELIEGEIIETSPIGRQHAASVKRITALFYQHVAQAAVISVQDPVRLSDYSEPQPDIALLRSREDFYSSGLPGPADTLLIVEVADTSLPYDRGVKLLLYARSGIPEVWLVDLSNETIEVYTQPANTGYQASHHARRGDSVVAQSIPGLTLSAEDILG
jgi:Uma2 family endonuclease